MFMDIERVRDKSVTYGASLTSSESKVHRIASNINRLMEQSEGLKHIGGPPPIVKRPRRGGRRMMPRGYAISWRRVSYKGTVSLASSKSCGAD